MLLFRFEDLFDRAIECDVGAVSVWVASIPDLIYLKRVADRPRDRKRCERTTWIFQLDAGSKFQGRSSWIRD